MIGLACNAYAQERLEVAELLEKAAPLASACGLWLNGKPAAPFFAQAAKQLRDLVEAERNKELDPED